MKPAPFNSQLLREDFPRILIVDDNRSIHRDFDLVLVDEAQDLELEAEERRTFGQADRPHSIAPTFALDHAYSGMEGIQKVEQALSSGSPYQLAFVDIRMPGIDGVETIERIWKRDPRIQTVICTAYADYSQSDLTQRLGFTDKLLVLRKPFDSIEVTQMAITLTEKWYLAVQAEMKLEQMEALVSQRTRQLVQIQTNEVKLSSPVPKVEHEIPASDSDQELPVILLLESNPDVCRQIRRAIGERFQMLEAQDAVRAFDLARENVPDLVLANVAESQLCRELKNDEMTSHIPVILFPGSEAESDPIRALEAGADDYLIFPLHTHLFCARVNQLLELRRKIGNPSAQDISLNPRELAGNQVDFQFLRRTIAVINQHLSDFEFDVELLSKKMFMSRRQFLRKIKAITGCAPNLLIRNLRLKRAAELLNESSMTVTEITYAVGFCDLKHFRNIFKERFGVLPGDYAEIPVENARIKMKIS